MDTERTYKIALSFTPGFTAKEAALLQESGISPQEFFSLGMTQLADRIGLPVRFGDIDRQEALFRARREEVFIEKKNIRAIYIFDDDYPVLLREIPDAPVLIYVAGNADLNLPHAFSVVGTRRCTSYGVNTVRSLVTDMAAYFPRAVVVSGLALGIDSVAHNAALDNGMNTFAVVAHGLDMIYPAQHRDLANRIILSGGAVISQYPSGIRPFQRNFLERNRIVAGMCEITVVAESEIKGGAMNTANYAFNYSREVVAVPGRVSDISSSGCNHLIEANKASIYTGVPSLLKLSGWTIPAIGASVAAVKPNLFPELEPNAAAVIDFMRHKSSPATTDEIHSATRLPMPVLMGILTELEFDGILSKLPGSRYELT